jgi:hypothetical protein
MTINICLLFFTLALAIGGLVTTVLIKKVLRNGQSVWLLVSAMAYAMISRTIIITNEFGITNIDIGYIGPLFYLLLLLGFVSLFFGIKHVMD